MTPYLDSNYPQLRSLRTRGDVQVLGWSGPVAELLPVLDFWLDRLDTDPMRQDPIRDYLLLVKDTTGNYNGLLPASGFIGKNLRQPYLICWFNEEHEDMALTTIKVAYDLGPDTNP